MSQTATLIADLEHALSAGTNAQRIEALTRVTDLFVASSGRYQQDHIKLFDDVFGRLVHVIEGKARAKLAVRLAPLSDAPSGVVKMLAFDEDIDVARPVLAGSNRLDENDLVATAQTQSQQHLAAIAERRSLPEAVTDVLVTRGDRNVVHSVVRNKGARFSDAGFRRLVQRSSGDDALAQEVGMRRDLPRQHYLTLIDEASVAVRAKLKAEHPAGAVDGVIGEVVGGMRDETRQVSRDYATARAEVEALYRVGKLAEEQVYGYARERRFEPTAIALSLLAGVESDAVERALLDNSHEAVLILARLAGVSSTTAKAILLMKSTERGMSAQDLDQALQSFSRLHMDTARRVLGFHRARKTAPPHVA